MKTDVSEYLNEISNKMETGQIIKGNVMETGQIIKGNVILYFSRSYPIHEGAL